MSEKSFWSIKPPVTDSWAWRKLLDLSLLALLFCKTRLGNGRTASFWFDVWTPLGQLIDYIGLSGPRSLRIRIEAVVADAIRGNVWTFSHPKSQKEVDLHAFLTTISLPLSNVVVDDYEWVAGYFPLRSFRSYTTWEILRPREEVKDWVDIVWFKGGIPKHVFTMWVSN